MSALSLTVGAVSKNINLPILNNVLIRASEQKVDFVATNLELAVTVSVRAVVDTAGSFTVPGRTLSDVVGLLSSEKIEVERKENELLISNNKTVTKIKGTPADEFPVIPEIDEGVGFVVGAEELFEGLSQVLPAVARTDIRPELAGVLFNFNSQEKQLILAATDSYRLAEKKLSLIQAAKDCRVVVPGKTAQEMLHTLTAQAEKSAQVRVLVGEGQIGLVYDTAKIVSRLVGGEYPDYTQIIPKESNSTATLVVEDLAKELKAAGLFTTSGVNAVMFELNPNAGTVSLASISTQTGEYHSELPADVKGQENKIALNHRYVLDGLSHLGDQKVEFRVINNEAPCVLVPEKNKSFLYIIMPIRQ